SPFSRVNSVDSSLGSNRAKSKSAVSMPGLPVVIHSATTCATPTEAVTQTACATQTPSTTLEWPNSGSPSGVNEKIPLNDRDSSNTAERTAGHIRCTSCHYGAKSSKVKG